MAKGNRISSRPIFKWECSQVELISVEVAARDYRERLARVAEELYPIFYQLHEKSNSLIHPGQILEPKAVALATKGVCDGNDIQEAA